MPPTFVSYAQNREDVMIRRALRDVEQGRYVDVGANDPTLYSVTRGFYDQGWSGITIEPVPAFVEKHRAERPRDRQVQAAVTAEPIAEVLLHVIAETGLSTLVDEISAEHNRAGWESDDLLVPARTLDAILADAGWEGADIHFMVVDVEGAEGTALTSLDLSRWRPWILVVEATAPRTSRPTHGEWEGRLLENGYQFCFFDGLSRFYVAGEQAAALKEALSYPACPLDEYDTSEALSYRTRAEELSRQVEEWQTVAMERWAEAMHGTAADRQLQGEIEAMRATVSWRITAPLRWVRGKLPS